MQFIMNEIFKVEASKVTVDVTMNTSYKNGEEYELNVFLDNNDNIIIKKEVKFIVSDDNIYQEVNKRHVVPHDVFKDAINIEFPQNKTMFCKELTTNKFHYLVVDRHNQHFDETKYINIFETSSVMLG